ncbi:DNA-binding protein inhibitor ID-2-like isoform X2 [Uloborus diversus]|uniref:DNA-binding protein inhibitor ID-2-like isoform X2 n=1 Tax=Uloborus diversus TaxID=327109 RepID=UPI002409D142|nr:DNA-binding protein inhibitor ID-2-like isoform X2 [Uloborus diversus]
MPVNAKTTKSKSGKNKRAKEIDNEEIQSLLIKLKEIVPNMPRNRRLSKLEIIQYVIDYIVDLQIALESHPPASSRPLSNPQAPRQPLGVISTESNSVNTFINAEKPVSPVPDVLSTSRSVSC